MIIILIIYDTRLHLGLVNNLEAQDSLTQINVSSPRLSLPSARLLVLERR